ncbi:XCT-like protein [Mya arenaria]|uniref:XCT-like protein n=1 Tax=Mya arenaria TaxID=6604 RepID=A0ABY7ESP8_MYAAR|nr:cystine/glutamate transporter-like isoform X1 [Mya arenaria]WAR11751.1 XCT-like protein [Mya arenaria]
MGKLEETEPTVEVEHHKLEMKRSISLFHVISILCSVTGHVSVFVAPAAILSYTGSIALSLILWVFGGIMNLFLALCFTELGTMFPKSGGAYAYILQVFGPLPGFLTAWGYLTLISGPHWAFCAYSASLYAMKPFYLDCKPPDAAIRLLAIWILVTFVAINCSYVKFVTKAQSVLTVTKLVALLLIIVCGLISFVKDGAENLSDPWEGTESRPFVIAMSLFFSVFTYGGWQIVTNLMEEVKNPGRDLPKAVYISMFIITAEFTLTNVAYYIVIDKYDVLQSTTVAMLFFERFYPPLMPVISALVAITAIGVLNCSILGHSRVLFAASRNEQAPVMFSMINTKFLTPWPAIFLLTLWSIVMLVSGALFTMMELVSLFSIILSFSVVVTQLYLRWKQPHAERPYKTFLFIPISQFALIIVVFFLCIYQEPLKLGRGLAILAAGLPAYWFGVLWRKKPKVYHRFMKYITVGLQKLLSVGKAA